ncbi:MAG: hypothetical protein SF123_09690 [Chloroflexota bacterium]|nr:hypothetical protein [Chloroflexota bacterium]
MNQYLALYTHEADTIIVGLFTEEIAAHHALEAAAQRYLKFEADKNDDALSFATDGLTKYIMVELTPNHLKWVALFGQVYEPGAATVTTTLVKPKFYMVPRGNWMIEIEPRREIKLPLNHPFQWLGEEHDWWFCDEQGRKYVVWNTQEEDYIGAQFPDADLDAFERFILEMNAHVQP